MGNYLRAGFTAILAILVLGEQFQTFHAVGLVLVIGGVFLMTRSHRRKAA
jgi:drug/metabolite transporter (DMT)-like permease